MLRNLRRKFVAVVMMCVFILMLITVGGVNLFMMNQMWQHYDQILQLLVDNRGEFPQEQESAKSSEFMGFGYRVEITEETPFETRYFVVYVDDEQNVKNVDISHISAVTKESAIEYAQRVFRINTQNENGKGTLDVYRYLIDKNEDGYIIGFVDMHQNIQNIHYVRMMSILICFTLFCILFIFVELISGRVLKPMTASIEKQKQFITDAGHELKTPLAVISANADVLELTAGKSEWIDSIRHQVGQLNDLIRHLLYLSRMEEADEVVYEELDFSQLVRDVAGRISTIALSQNKEFTMDIQEGITLKGDARGLEHLISVLTENAVKYCVEEGQIHVKLSKGVKTICLEISNMGEPIDGVDMKRLFDRFYRPDSSRNRSTGGHGIGLSIAKAIVSAHKGRITARNVSKGGQSLVVFRVEL